MTKIHVNRDHEGNPVIPLNVHWKQGDAFQRHLDANGDDVAKALESWGQELALTGSGLTKLARLIRDSGEVVNAYGGTHYAEIAGVSEALAVKALAEAPEVVPKQGLP